MNIENTTYEILYECKERTKDGHKKYHVRCTLCNQEFDRRLDSIKNVHCCTHLNRFDYPSPKYKWKYKELSIIYRGIIQRCYNNNNLSYKFYGGKNIKLCTEWENHPKNFEQWAINNGYQIGSTIDRIDPNKNYSPDNCRWVTHSYNTKYKSTTHLINVNGKQRTGREWSILLKLGINTINKMYRKYGEELTAKFIKARIKDMSKKMIHGKSWLEIYNIVN